MKIGIVCEGPTDFFAVQNFFEEVLSNYNIEAEIISLQPDMDNTRPSGGWAPVLTWLENNNAATRVKKYLGKGLFASGLSAKTVDAILIQIDSDILGEDSFENYIERKFGFKTELSQTKEERSDQIKRVLHSACQIDRLDEENKNKHILCPAVESTEAWCIVVFQETDIDVFSLRGQDLVNAFGRVFQKSLGVKEENIQEEFININKNQKSRKKFCQKYRGGSNLLFDKCSNFRESVLSIVNLYQEKENNV